MSPSEKQVYGLVGYPVGHSLSPAMQAAAFKEAGINAEYRLFEVKPGELEDFLLNRVFQEGIRGLNITIPHKIKAKEILEKNYPAKKRAMTAVDWYYLELTGAVNTVKREGGALLYWNTDAGGFFRSLFEELKFKETKGKSALIIGCGGAGRAVVAALSWDALSVEKIYIYENSPEAIKSAEGHFFGLAQADSLRKRIEFIPEEKIKQAIRGCHLLVNASSVGMKDDRGSVITREVLKENKGLSVYDVIYNRKTQLIRDAEALGYPAASGLGMLLYQGVYSFKYWTGGWPNLDVMRRALEEEVAKLCSQQ